MINPAKVNLIDSLLLVSRYDDKEKQIRFERIAEIFIWIALILSVIVAKSPFGKSLDNLLSYFIVIGIGVFALVWFRLIPRKFSGNAKNLVYTVILNVFIAYLVANTNGLQSFAVFFFYIDMLRMAMSTPLRYTIISNMFVIGLIFVLVIISDGTLHVELSLAIFHTWGLMITAFFGRFITGDSAIAKENENKATLEKEIELSKIKDEFVYIISQKLKKPIQEINKSLEGIISGYSNSLDSESNELLKLTEVNSDRLDSLLNDLLDVSKIEQGSLPIHLTDVSIKPIVGEVISTLLLDANSKRISIINRINEEIAAKADLDRLKEVLVNLIGNAIKYTPEGGKITVEASKENDLVTIKVSDNGIGISDEDQKHLFEKFYRVENERTQYIKGSGLGLFITKQLIEKMGGRINFVSKVGEGSSFYFTLPRYRW